MEGLGARREPVVLEADACEDVVEVDLPPGFSVEETECWRPLPDHG